MQAKRQLKCSSVRPPNFIHFVAVACFLMCSLSSEAQKKPSSSSIRLSVQIRDALGDKMRSDGISTVYDDDAAGGNGDVNAEITSQGQFVFGTQPTIAGRGVYVDFGLAPGAPPAGIYDIALGTTAADCPCPELGCDPSLAGAVDFTRLPLSAPSPVGLIIHIWPNPPLTATEWIIVFGNWPEGCAKFPCAGGDDAWVTRTAVDAWTLESFGTTPVCLLEAVPIGGKRVRMESRGQIVFPFRLSLTVQN